MAMLGEQFMVGPEVCGAVVSLRYQVQYPFVWSALIVLIIQLLEKSSVILLLSGKDTQKTLLHCNFLEMFISKKI